MSQTRRTWRVHLRLAAQDVLSHLKGPSQRAFTNVRSLHLNDKCTRNVQQWVLLGDALTAAAAAWPQLEEVQLNGCGDR
jgi:hypothetical protein